MKKAYILLMGCVLIVFVYYYFKPSKNDQLILASNTTYKEGLISLMETIKQHNIPYNPGKPTIMYFWDSIDFNYYHRERIHKLDSLADALHKSAFNFLIVTEMSAEAGKNFLNNRISKISNCQLIYNSQDFVSGVYNEFDSTLSKSKTGIKYKFKPYYFITDSKGNVKFSGSGMLNTNFDPAISHIINALAQTH